MMIRGRRRGGGRKARLKLWRQGARKAGLHVTFYGAIDDVSGANWRRAKP